MALDVGSLPQILAGPIVRRVSKSNIAIWVALRNSASVTLEVIQPANPNATPPLPKISLGSLPVNTVSDRAGPSRGCPARIAPVHISVRGHAHEAETGAARPALEVGLAREQLVVRQNVD